MSIEGIVFVFKVKVCFAEFLHIAGLISDDLYNDILSNAYDNAIWQVNNGTMEWIWN